MIGKDVSSDFWGREKKKAKLLGGRWSHEKKRLRLTRRFVGPGKTVSQDPADKCQLGLERQIEWGTG